MSIRRRRYTSNSRKTPALACRTSRHPSFKVRSLPPVLPLSDHGQNGTSSGSAIPKSGDHGTIVSCFSENGLHHFITQPGERFRLSWVRTRHERQSDTIVAIFVFSYFRAFVIDSISSHHNSFHDKRRGVEVEEQADAETRCTEIGPHRCEVHVLQGFDGF